MENLKKDRKIASSLISIITGLFAFLGFNFYYALSSIEGLNPIFKDILLIVSIISLIAFVSIILLSLRGYSTPISKLKYIITAITAFLICGWIILTGAVYFFRYDVLYTNSPVRKSFNEMGQSAIEKISIVTHDNVVLQGYLSRGSEMGKSPLAIYFGGRGEEASGIGEYYPKTKGCSLAFINYRGCGSSGGFQDENSFFSDATLIYDYFASREDIDKDNIALIAHSLGTGVAVHLASERDVKGVVLSAPYDTYSTGVIQDKLPLVPTSLLFSDRLDSLSLAPKVEVPALFLFAENDNTVSRDRSLKLYDSWGGDAEKVIINGTHHEDITLNDTTWNNINDFLDEIFY